MIRSRRLRLAPIGVHDLAGILDLHRDPRVTALLVDTVPDTPELVGLLLAWNAALARKGFGTFSVRRHDDPALIGLFSLTPFKEDESLLELGGRLGPAAWRGGLGVEAAAALIDHAFGALGRDRLVSAFHPDHRSARAALVRLGFADAGRTEMFGREVAVVALDRARWAARASPNGETRAD